MSARPLQGRRIVVTRSVAQAASLCRHLSALGAEPIAIPTIDFVPMPTEPLIATLRQIDTYRWLIFTSVNAVEFFFAVVAAQPESVALPPVAAIGSATTRRLAEQGVTPDFVPEVFTGEALATGLGDLRGQRVLLPRARIGRPQIVTQLAARGAVVDDIPLYDTVPAAVDAGILAHLQHPIDAITFTSPSSVRNFLKILDDAHLDDVRQRLHQTRIACIGPTTAAEADRFGLPVHAIPEEYTIDGLAAALVHLFQPPPSSPQQTTKENEQV